MKPPRSPWNPQEVAMSLAQHRLHSGSQNAGKSMQFDGNVIQQVAQNLDFDALHARLSDENLFPFGSQTSIVQHGAVPSENEHHSGLPRGLRRRACFLASRRVEETRQDWPAGGVRSSPVPVSPCVLLLLPESAPKFMFEARWHVAQAHETTFFFQQGVSTQAMASSIAPKHLVIQSGCFFRSW